jgi:hypothetical protein
VSSDRPPDPSTGSTDLRALQDALDAYLAGVSASPAGSGSRPELDGPDLVLPEPIDAPPVALVADMDGEPPMWNKRRRALIGALAALLIVAGLLVVLRNPFSSESGATTSISAVPSTTPQSVVATSRATSTTRPVPSTSTSTTTTSAVSSLSAASTPPTTVRPRTTVPPRTGTTAPRATAPPDTAPPPDEPTTAPPPSEPETTVPDTTLPASEPPPSTPPVTDPSSKEAF